jgi:hypothetical protein
MNMVVALVRRKVLVPEYKKKREIEYRGNRQPETGGCEESPDLITKKMSSTSKSRPNVKQAVPYFMVNDIGSSVNFYVK